ncbi:MAG TPA: lasso peptide biosynthesis B2 protein, partial [Epsilonproteobacteria bacterium]|nr:lasso peptide biosynthesis B2 protein [Campylobacterota bacterium]
MISKFKKFTKLPWEEQKLFAEAYLELGQMRVAILTVSFKRLTRSLEHRIKVEELSPLNEEAMRTARLVGQAIVRASAFTPWESACLAQSLTAQKMLQKRGIPGVFYLGVAKDE